MDEIATTTTFESNSSFCLWVGKGSGRRGNAARMKRLLSAEEVKRAEMFHFERDSLRYTTAHAVLRSLLSAYTHQKPCELVFAKTPHGKPFLRDFKQLRFNISHSADLIAIVCSTHTDVGVDIERVASFDSLGNLAAEIMTNEELQCFARLEEHGRVLFFFNCWVRKEAVVKAWGVGIGEELKKIATMGPFFSPAKRYVATRTGVLTRFWRVETIDVGPGYSGAVCVEQAAVNATAALDTNQLGMANAMTGYVALSWAGSNGVPGSRTRV